MPRKKHTGLLLFRHDGRPVLSMEVGRMQYAKQLRRPHYTEEWTRTKGWRQADLARELGADKGIVSRWFAGATPGVEWQEKLAALFSIEPEDLFSDPSERWFREFIRGHTDEEIEHIKRSLEVTFPRKGHNQRSTGPA